MPNTEKPRKRLVERRWFQSLAGLALLVLLVAAFVTENYNYRLLGIALPAGLAVAWAWVLAQDELRGEPRLAALVAALLLMPFFAWPLWVIANVANKFDLHDPVQRHATVESHKESFLHSGRSTRRYALVVKLEETGKELEFIVQRKAEEYGRREPVCEWKGLLGFTTYTLGSCRKDWRLSQNNSKQPEPPMNADERR